MSLTDLTQPDHRSRTSAPAEPVEPPGQSIASVERAVDILILLGRSVRGDLGVTEIATTLGMSRSAVHRCLTVLVRWKFVLRDASSRRYSLGPAALALGRAYVDQLDVRELARPELAALSEQTGETATLSIRRFGARIYLDQVTPPKSLRVQVALGQPAPLHTGAASHAFLAFVSEDEREAYLTGSEVAPRRDEPPVDVAALRAELDLIRERGWAVSYGDGLPGAVSIAVPVFDYDGEAIVVLAAIGPVERFPNDVATSANLLLDAASRLSANLGFTAAYGTR